MYKFNQVFVDKLKASGVDITCDPESIRNAIAYLDTDSFNIDEVIALSWIWTLLDCPEDSLCAHAEHIAIALSALDKPSKTLVLDKLKEYFKSQFALWNWGSIKNSAAANVEPEPMSGDRKWGWGFLGSVLALVPSGKFYTPWANSNVSEVEAEIDALWYEALSAIAEANGMSIENGEGDPCDLFAVICIDDEDEDDESE